MEDSDRQTGRTTRQMETAPIGSLFIWVNARLDYPKLLAARLGRTDLQIISPGKLEQGAIALRGQRFSSILIDHAALLTDDQWDGWESLQPYIMRGAG